MKAVRVAHLGKYLPPVLGGMETSVYQICDRLAAFENTKIRLIGANTENSRLHYSVTPQFEISKLARFKEIFSTPILKGLHSEIEEFDPAIIHLHLPNPYLSWLLKLKSRPLVITYHCEILTYPALLKLYSPILERTLQSASKIIATSEQLIENSPYLRKHRNKCAVIPLGIVKDPISQSNEKSDEMVEKIYAEHGRNLVLFVGRLVPYKGLRDLIGAMSMVSGKLLVVGSGPLSQELNELVRTLKLSNKVAFLGAVSNENLQNFYRAARVVALTSIDEREAFGMCLVEALSYGKPLITTRIPSGVQFVNQDGITGLQVEVGDVVAIGQAISRLLSDDQLWLKMSTQAKQHFHAHFEISSVARAYRKIYNEVC